MKKRNRNLIAALHPVEDCYNHSRGGGNHFYHVKNENTCQQQVLKNRNPTRL